jgi:hypothetical protein
MQRISVKLTDLRSFSRASPLPLGGLIRRDTFAQLRAALEPAIVTHAEEISGRRGTTLMHSGRAENALRLLTEWGNRALHASQYALTASSSTRFLRRGGVDDVEANSATERSGRR